MPTVPSIHQRGTRALQPMANAVTIGTLYYVTDESKTERSNGTIWESYSDGSTTAPIHATTHSSGGTDPVNVTNLAGFPGGTTSFLRADGTFAAAGAASHAGVIGLVIDGGSSVITTGFKTAVQVPFNCTITGWTILSNDAAITSGSIVIDVWKDTYANYPPTVADTITASAKPTLSSATKATSTTLTGWTTAITAGDIIGFNVDSVALVKKITLTLTVTV